MQDDPACRNFQEAQSEHAECGIQYLSSPDASQALAADPYWPKWDAPWWRLTLLWELGELQQAPADAVTDFLGAIGRYPGVFPFRIEDVPAGVDPISGILCHCALGTAYQVLLASGVPVDHHLPWARPWFLRYQLADGGLNCDEAAYTRPTPRSSVVSTLPAVEAVLSAPQHSPAEVAFLDRGAAYLVARRLCRSISRHGSIISPSWFSLIFPRYYRYDVLRGLAFLVRWALCLDRSLPVPAIAEALSHIHPDTSGRLAPGRPAHEGEGTRVLVDGTWRLMSPARTFALLDEVAAVGLPSRALTRQWAFVRSGLRKLAEAGRLTPDLRK